MYVEVRATPGAKKERVRKDEAGVWYIQIKEPAHQNRANERIREIIAHEYGVPVGQVRLVSGQRSQKKMLCIEFRN